MPSPLKRTLAGLFILCGAGMSAAAATVAPCSDADPDVYAAELPPGQVLPVDGIDLPVSATPAGRGRTSPLSPSIEAIPTPTAFHAGFALMVAIAVGRRLGRRRARSLRQG